MPLSNTQFDNRLAVTIPLWGDKILSDLITGNNPLFVLIKEQGNYKIGASGHGGQIVEPVMFPDLTGPVVTGITNAAAAYTALAFAETTNMTAASYIVAEKVLPISVQEYDLKAQGSDTAKLNLIESIMKISVARFNENLNSDLWAAPETVTSGGTRSSLMSLQTALNGGTAATTDGGSNPPALTAQQGNRAVCSTATATPILNPGGINRAAAGAAYWTTPLINTSQAISVQVLSNMVSLATRGSDSPNLIVLHRDKYDQLLGLLTNGGSGGGQIYTQSKLADAGFGAIRFRGVDVVQDDRVPAISYLNGSATAYAYNAFCINTNYFNLKAINKTVDIKEYPDSRPIRIWAGYWSGQLTSSNLGRVHSRHVALI